MPSRNYETQELILESQLDSMLWLEVAQRHARKTVPSTLSALFAVRKRLEEKGRALAAAISDPCDRDQVEEDYANLVFDRAQFGDDGPLRRLSTDIVGPIVAEAEELMISQIRFLEAELPCARGFTLADFSLVNDMSLLLHWWIQVVIPMQPRGRFRTSFRVPPSDGVGQSWERYVMPATVIPIRVAPAEAAGCAALPSGLPGLHQLLLERHKATQTTRLFKQHDGLKRIMLAMMTLSAIAAGAGSQSDALATVLQEYGQHGMTTENIRVATRRLHKLIQDYHPELLPWRRTGLQPAQPASSCA